VIVGGAYRPSALKSGQGQVQPRPLATNFRAPANQCFLTSTFPTFGCPVGSLPHRNCSLQPFLIFIADIIVRTLSLPQLQAMSINTWDKLAKAQRDYPKPRYASAVVDKASKKDPKNPYLIVSMMTGIRCVLC
jgi:hypothetical protein